MEPRSDIPSNVRTTQSLGIYTFILLLAQLLLTDAGERNARADANRRVERR